MSHRLAMVLSLSGESALAVSMRKRSVTEAHSFLQWRGSQLPAASRSWTTACRTPLM